MITHEIDKSNYEVSVLIPWYGQRFYTGIDSTILYDELDDESWQAIFDAPTSDLISIIRKTIPAIKQHNLEEDLEI